MGIALDAVAGPGQETLYARRPEIPDSADIWEHVQFHHPPEWRLGGGPLTPGRSYLSFGGEVSWEPEHGLQLVYEDGRRVCKASRYPRLARCPGAVLLSAAAPPLCAPCQDF
ncbi:DUF6985 domain-containing protein [Allosalinactinospora lopnorensis]|uniref:DUF6985 domain-containing protein n=1 Tax=Allosalinactinospora lopnorensis TaxID=1352348 RepID=UPI00373FC9BC